MVVGTGISTGKLFQVLLISLACGTLQILILIVICGRIYADEGRKDPWLKSCENSIAKKLLIYFRGKSASCQQRSIMFLEDFCHCFHNVSREITTYTRVKTLLQYFFWFLYNSFLSLNNEQFSYINFTYQQNWYNFLQKLKFFLCVFSRNQDTHAVSNWFCFSVLTYICNAISLEWVETDFFNVTLEYFSRPIVGAWECEVTAEELEAVFRALGDTLSRASAEADCVAAVLLHYIIEYPYFNSWLPWAINKE